MTLNEYVNSIKDKRIAVIGVGVSNTPLINLLLSCGCNVTVCDKRSLSEMGMEALDLINRGAKLKLGEDYLEGLDHDIIFRTPGLMPFDPHLEAAKARGSLITSEMEVFFALCPCKTIAVTGSDGKTTTTTIISELLKAAGYRVHLGGNIGHPLLCEIPETVADDIAVLELSSFQLHSMYCKPNVAVVTNISPNHLDKHKDYQDYIDAKRAEFEHQNEDDKLILNFDDEHSAYYAHFAHAPVSYFSDKNRVDRGVICENGVILRVNGTEQQEIMVAEEIKLPGEHNLLNYLAAFAAVDGLVSNEICRQVAMTFAGVEHRLEQVRVLNGVTYINDSIGTSPTRTSAGLHALKVKPIVIAGGYDKHIPFDGLGDELCRFAKRVFLTGDTAESIHKAIVNSPYYAESGLEVQRIDDFKEAVLAASASAEAGDIVLLSPACAAFDRFKNFAERGKYFKEIVMELK
ncbi:MAG: UDP-N-acetylmuramoyl-L-alanine--D-glutamate ligase [Candidatus Limivicinus sp.]|nr:UDP-N-acetylmuramoyl-L-alanine--D-glutamate ligase [Clostridiales bacterium]MDY6133987.1 UDP-N-acetylmuramoyl-L-alanine--D-glutamate ligase [Candidatus Limivicinus sp.]